MSSGQFGPSYSLYGITCHAGSSPNSGTRGSYEDSVQQQYPITGCAGEKWTCWEEHERTKVQYFSNGPTESSDWNDPAAVVLTLSRWLIMVVKAKKVLNIEAGFEMIALGMAISSEVHST